VTHDALAQLYTQYGAFVHRRCRALLGSEADANDALQETFMRVQRYPPGDDVKALLPWLYGVATRVCFDQLAVHRRAQPAGSLLTRLSDWVGRVTRDPVDERLCLAAELARLDETTREMAVLHWLDGLTQEEVAAKTGYSRRTVGTKLKDAEAQLRAAYRGGEP
jgi:RNA polymerase sigma-70 factor (ECF subfamily)